MATKKAKSKTTKRLKGANKLESKKPLSFSFGASNA
jgi:hypothetical protein